MKTLLRRSSVLLAASGLLALPLPANAQSIANHSFEIDTFTVFPGYISGNAPVTGWTELTPTQQGINPGGGSPFANNGTIPDGEQVGFIQSNNNTNSFSNTITELTPGQQYQLSFRVNARDGQQTRMSVEVGGVPLVGSLVNSVGGANPYGYLVANFTATAASMPLAVISSSATDNTLLIDDFQVSPIASTPWSVTAWTGDADSGIDPASTYTHAFNLGNGTDTTLNGIEFIGVAGGSPSLPGSFSLVGPGNVLPADTNSLTAAGGGSGVLGIDFVYNGNPAILTLEGLTPGQSYRTSIFGVGWDDNTTSNRTATFESGGEMLTIDEDQFNNDNGIRIDFEFLASGTTQTITYDPLGGNTFHTYAFANAIVDKFRIGASPLTFSRIDTGDLVSTLTAFDNLDEEAATFGFAAGAGDTDNSKFQIVGDRLEIGTHDFSADPDGTQYAVRIEGTGTVSAKTAEASFVLTLTKDTDSDMLPDEWELIWALDLTELSGLGGANFDMDSLTDLEEFQISTSSYPNINPKLADSDADNLEDGAEIAGADMRPPTDPTDDDSDGDGLGDEVETNTGIFINASDTGSDPTNVESDGDGFDDGIEVAAGSDPNDPNSIPPLPDGFAVGGPITDLESSGISGDDNYTHAISGGGIESVDGVTFELIDGTTTPANILWEVSSIKNQINDNNGGWDVGASGLTDPELLGLLGSFTYNNDGNPGSSQTFTLSGLSPGESYETRLYMRKWDNSTSRGQTVSFTAGAAATDSLTFFEDHPELAPIGMPSRDSAWYLSYTYTADAAGTLAIGFEVQESGAVQGNPGSFHMYALTNRIASAPIEFKITDITYTAGEAPSVSFTFNSKPGATYGIYASTSLLATGTFPGGWVELDDSYESQGTETSYTDIQFPGLAPRVFYQVRETP